MFESGARIFLSLMPNKNNQSTQKITEVVQVQELLQESND